MWNYLVSWWPQEAEKVDWQGRSSGRGQCQLAVVGMGSPWEEAWPWGGSHRARGTGVRSRRVTVRFLVTLFSFSLPLPFHPELGLVITGLQSFPHPLTTKEYKKNEEAKFIRGYHLLE